MASEILDCKGLNCPMPIVKLSKRMRDLESGDELIVEATDPAFKADLHAWAKRFGHEIQSFEAGDVLRATVTKS